MRLSAEYRSKNVTVPLPGLVSAWGRKKIPGAELHEFDMRPGERHERGRVAGTVFGMSCTVEELRTCQPRAVNLGRQA